MIINDHQLKSIKIKSPQNIDLVSKSESNWGNKIKLRVLKLN